MQRPTTFRIGGGLAIALGVALGAGLAWSRAGLAFASAWLAAAISVGLGLFFLHVAREADRYRRAYLRALEEGRPPPAGGPPV